MSPVMHNAPTDAVLKRFGIREIIECIDTWAQKFVFIAKDHSGNMRALKVPKTSHGEREARETNFYRQFAHLPRIPKVIDSELLDGKEICLEDYIEWTGLEKIMVTYIWNADGVKCLLKEICLILQPIWNTRITHRDIKPSNIIISPDWTTPNVIDFWIARDDSLSCITTTGFQPHSPKYWSPEQIRWRRDLVDIRTDFYSLGILGYELLYWSAPFGTYEAPTNSVMLDLWSNKSVAPQIQENCPLAEFFGLTLQKHPYQRARNAEILLASLI